MSALWAVALTHLIAFMAVGEQATNDARRASTHHSKPSLVGVTEHINVGDNPVHIEGHDSSANEIFLHIRKGTWSRKRHSVQPLGSNYGRGRQWSCGTEAEWSEKWKWAGRHAASRLEIAGRRLARVLEVDFKSRVRAEQVYEPSVVKTT